MIAIERLRPGALFAGQYRVVRPLGDGALYLVEAAGGSRTVEVLDPALVEDDAQRARFAQVPSVVARVASEHVAAVLDAGVDPASGAPFLVLEPLEGETLEDHARSRGALPPARVRELLEQVARGLEPAHGAAMVHGELDLESVFLAGGAFTAGDQVKLLGFGVAGLLELERAPTARLLHRAPEQAERGRPWSPATDVWAIGLIAFRLLTARPYWLAANHPNVDRDALLAELAGGARVSASQRARELRARSVPAGFDAWFARCLRPDPEQRFASAREAVDALRPALDAPGIPLAATAPMQATPRPEPVAPFAQPAPPKPAPRDSGLTTAVMALGAIFVAAIAVTGLWALNQDWSDESDLPPPPPAPLAQPAWPPPPIPAQAEVASPPRGPTEAPPDVAGPGPDAERTPTGLASRVIEAGTGLVHPGPRSRVRVHYTGWTTDGAMFDSSYTRDHDATFGLHQVIAGWTEGVQLMVEGERRLFWIPEDLAYRGRPGAPQGMLVFDVRLLEILDTPEPPPTPPDVAAAPADAQRTASGLASRVLAPGTGAVHPGPADRVTVHYTGWTTDGEMFDSSIPRGAPATFPLNRVIAGWTEGLQLMVEGERRRLWIPPALAYEGRSGPQGVLVFDVELIAIAPPE